MEKGDFEVGVALKKFRTTGGGRKSRTLEVREALFQWFIDVRTSLKARLPKSLFLLKAKKFYEDWLQQHPDTAEEEKLQFSNQSHTAMPRHFLSNNSFRDTMHKKSSFSLRISSVNVTKSAVSLWIWSHLLKKSLNENFSFCAVATPVVYYYVQSTDLCPRLKTFKVGLSRSRTFLPN